MGFFGATCLTSLVFPAAWAWNEFGTIDLGTVLWLALLLVTASVVLFVLFAVAVLLLLVGVARRLSRRVVQS